MPRGIYIRTNYHKDISKKYGFKKNNGMNKGINNPMYGKTHSKKYKAEVSERFKGRSGIKHPLWKGGRKKTEKGYIYIYSPNHPNKTSVGYGYVFEHRLIMEKIIGRYLTKNEMVHHKNGIKDDNKPENLYLVIKGKNWHPCICPNCGFDFLIK